MIMIRKYYLLTKPGIIFGNLVTAFAGYILASKEDFESFQCFLMLFGLALVVGSGCVFNNFIDRFIDRKMKRTKHRPLAKGTISTKNANIFGVSLLLLGSGVLFQINLLCAGLALFGFFMYVFVYSYLKHKTVFATAIGSVAGAIPPVIGYTAYSYQVDLAAFLLFLIVTFWQMPHFFAIAMYRIDDYAAASIPVFPIKKGAYATKLRILFYIFAFTLSSLILGFFYLAGKSYLIAASVLGVSWFFLGVKGFKSVSDQIWARKMFLSSLVVILVLCTMISINPS